MNYGLIAMSHAPTFGLIDPGQNIENEIRSAIDEAKGFIEKLDPEVVIAIGPDHFNGVLYEMMPQFCIGAQASGVGDWGTAEGHLPVDAEVARMLIKRLLDENFDVARSEKLKVDHGIVQPLQFLLGEEISRPFVPVFVNAVGLPLNTVGRVWDFGQSLGRLAAATGKRTLFVGSGGLSHDPPIPEWESASIPVKERITSADITREEISAREQSILRGAAEMSTATVQDTVVREDFDQEVLKALTTGNHRAIRKWTNEWLINSGGKGALEIRAWVAAFGALAATGEFTTPLVEYWPVHNWGTGFSMVAGVSND